MKKQYAVFGLGSFGESVAVTLQSLGCEVVAVDNHMERIEEIANKVSYAMKANVGDPEVIRSVGARNLDGVTALRDAFAARGLEVYTQAEAIAQVRQLSGSLDLIFSLIGAAAAVGFLTSTASSMLAAVARKERLLGLLRLMGFSTGALLLFPLAQSLLTALLGTGLACGLYLLAAQVVNHLFAASLSGLESVCRLLPVHYAATLLIVAGLSLLAALGPALRAGRIEPSEVIREI